MVRPSVGDVMAAVRNYFPKESYDGEWSISGGRLSPVHELLAGDWIAITGSARNDGVYRLDNDMRLKDVTDEHFNGRVWLLAPPPAFLALCEEIAAWCSTHPHDGVRSEHFGSYGVTYTADRFGLPVGWQQSFAAELVPWRRMYTGVKLG